VSDPALDLRAELTRTAAALPVGDLVPAVHRRAGRIRRRRRFASGVAAVAAVAAAMAVAVPAVRSRPDGPDRRTGGAVNAPASGASPSPGSPTPLGLSTMDEGFDGLDRSRWTVYDGPGDALGRWSPGDVAVAGGNLRLSVRRPGGTPPSTWGGIGAMGAARRYGRWEVRMRMSSGRGVIGQFLLNPTGADPAIVVSISPFQGTISVSGTGTGTGGTRVAPLAGPADVHVVAVEWTPQAVRVLVDGSAVFEWTDGAPAVPLWPALQAIMAGPDCGAVPLPSDCQGTATAFPQRLDVDGLRVQGYRG
jgi:hypothetical protein